MNKIYNVYYYSTTWSVYLFKTLRKVIVRSEKGRSKLLVWFLQQQLQATTVMEFFN